jgi:hypothetical protein
VDSTSQNHSRARNWIRTSDLRITNAQGEHGNEAESLEISLGGGASKVTGVTCRGVPTSLGELVPFAAREDGRRNVGIRWPGVSVLVERTSDDPEAAAEALARLPIELAEARARVAEIEPKVPPARPARIFDGGCVRQDPQDPSKLWLLSSPAKGWGAFGVRVEGGWDDLFRHYDVIVGEVGSDAAGTFWAVHPRAVAP